MNSIWSAFFMLFCWSVAGAQSSHGAEQQHAKNDDQTESIHTYLLAIDQAKSVENDELVYELFRKIQANYTAQFKLDSSAWIFEKGEQFARMRGNFKKYFDFKLGRGEIMYMQGANAESNMIFTEIVEDKNVLSFHFIRAHLRLSAYNRIQSDSSSAYRHVETALKRAQVDQDSSILGLVFETYANVEHEFGRAYRAIDLFQKSIVFHKQQGRGFRLGDINRRIGYIFQTVGNYDKALEFGHQALSVAEEGGHGGSKALAENLLGELYLNTSNYIKAKHYFQRALTHNVLKNKRDRLLNLHSHLASVEMNLDLPGRAHEHLELAFSYLNSNSGVNARFHYYWKKARYELEFTDKIKAAKRTIDTCEYIAQMADKEFITQQTLDMQVKYYKKIKNFEAALQKKEEYVNLSNQIEKKNQSRLVHDLEAKYQNQILDKELVQLSTANLLNESKLNQQQIVIYSGILALFALGFIGYFFYRLYKRVNAQKETIDRALADKELLLREIHHRVKNNLQVISSLLALQSGYVQDEKAIEALKHGQDRVQSMALIHQDLYQADNLKGVNVQNYFEKLIDNLFESYQVDDGDIKLNIEVEPIVLDVDTMIPLGLVVNELMSNVLKHAFKGRSSGQVALSLKERDETLILTIKDNGVGLENASDLAGDTFGFQMINAFASKLKAQIEVKHDNGLEVELLIKNYSKTK